MTKGSTLTLSNVTFRSNWGSGMYNYHSSPTLTNVTFSSNWDSGMYNHGSSPTLTNVTFSGNTASLGGGIYNKTNSSPTLTNVTFSANRAYSYGGGIYNYNNSKPTIRDTIFWGNTAPNDPQIYNYDTTSTPSLSDSVVQGGCPAGSSSCTKIITADPRLGALGNWGGSTQTIPLLPGSSAIDAGNDATCAAFDQRGVPRPQGAHCDIGAFEGELTLLQLNLPLIRR